jgi:hypothetical protein
MNTRRDTLKLLLGGIAAGISLSAFATTREIEVYLSPD